jgi:RNase P/RNase MRP subunit p29
MSADYQTADVVNIVSGKYQGLYGRVMKVTTSMIVVRVSATDREVRVLKSSVRLRCHGAKISSEHGLPQVVELKHLASVDVTQLRIEVARLQCQIDALTDLIAKLDVKP